MSDNMNNARMATFGSYRAVFDVQCVDDGQKIWKGRPVIEERMKKIGIPIPEDPGWIFFSREYDTRENKNDWDLLYHEFIFPDEKILGVPFMLVPKEKLLFGYNEPTKSILLPQIRH